MKNTTQLSDDSCFEILTYLDDWFTLKICTLISKQWFEVVKHRIYFSLSFRQSMDQNASAIGKSQFLANIFKVTIGCYIGKNSLMALHKMDQLTWLDIHSNKIDANDAQYIGEMGQLKYLDIGCNQIESGFKSICKLKQLTCLKINNNQLGDEEMRFISQLSELTELNLNGNDIHPDGAKEIQKLCKLTHLELNCNEIGHIGSQCIGKLSQLTYLDIYNNRINDLGVQGLINLNQLTFLNVGYNRLSAISALYLCEMKHLKILKIRNNSIQEGLELLSNQLFNTTIEQ